MTDPVRIDVPQAGFYQTKLIKGGVWVAVRIWWGFPTSLEADETTDRLPGWNAERDGEPVDVFQVWPDCSDEPIPDSEYAFMLARAAHDRIHNPNSPYANPRRRIDPMTAPLPVFNKR